MEETPKEALAREMMNAADAQAAIEVAWKFAQEMVGRTSIELEHVKKKLAKEKNKIGEITVDFGKGKTEYGTGVQIDITGQGGARAIYAYLAAHGVYISGAATITVNGKLIKEVGIYVDPSGSVVANGVGYSGRGEKY